MSELNKYQFRCFNCKKEWVGEYDTVGPYGTLSDGLLHDSNVVCSHSGGGTYVPVTCPVCSQEGPHGFRYAEQQ